MRKISGLVGIFFLFFSALGFAQNHATEPSPSFKKAMERAIDNEKITDSLYQILIHYKHQTPIIQGYEGTLLALKAKHTLNPYQKIKLLKASLNTLKSAIHKEPNHIELRFMRLSVQYFVPSFLGLSKDMLADKNTIIQLFKNKELLPKNPSLLHGIAEFLIEKKLCNASEIKILKPYV